MSTLQQSSSATPRKLTVATAWLDGCSGCHMSFLDLDERLLALAELIDVVYSPLVDAKQLPEQVDLGILEGAVSNENDLQQARIFRQHCKVLISLGDCAVTGNVPAMRNTFPLKAVFERAYDENVTQRPGAIPTIEVPALLPHVQPLHAVVPVDIFIPGCPPRADAIYAIVADLLAGKTPDPNAVTRFGA